MDSVSLHQFLVLYTWFPLIAILLLLLLIARFYQKFSGDRTFFQGYLIPVIGYGFVAVRYAARETISGDMFADIVALISGVILLILAFHLYRCMMARSRLQKLDRVSS
ncbi:MAG: hypothetical protein ACPG7F_12110 [Aggregatilineales bacterium]